MRRSHNQVARDQHLERARKHRSWQVRTIAVKRDDSVLSGATNCAKTEVSAAASPAPSGATTIVSPPPAPSAPQHRTPDT